MTANTRHRPAGNTTVQDDSPSAQSYQEDAETGIGLQEVVEGIREDWDVTKRQVGVLKEIVTSGTDNNISAAISGARPLCSRVALGLCILMGVFYVLITTSWPPSKTTKGHAESTAPLPIAETPDRAPLDEVAPPVAKPTSTVSEEGPIISRMLDEDRRILFEAAQASSNPDVRGEIVGSQACNDVAGGSWLSKKRKDISAGGNIIDLCTGPKGSEHTEVKCQVWDSGPVDKLDVVRDYYCTASRLTASKEDMIDGRLKLQGHCQMARKGLRFDTYTDSPNEEIANLYATKEVYSEDKCSSVLGSDKPVIIFRPAFDNHKNAWYVHLDALSIYITIALSGRRPDQVQLLINSRSDLVRDAIFRVAHLYQLVAPDIIYPDGIITSQASTVCFRQVLFPVPVGQLFLNTMKPCGPSSVIIDYGRRLMEQSKLQSSFLQKNRRADRDFRITLIQRYPSFSRRIANPDEVLQSLVFRSSGVSVRRVPFATMTMKNQMEAAASTDLLIGPHGGALFWMIAQPVCGQVIELGARGQFALQYAYLSGWSERQYAMLPDLVGYDDPVFEVPVQQLLPIVMNMYKRWKVCMSRQHGGP
ncbi:hypothetical protein FOZ63_018585 [Perkinsus olseni]|uniref:Glycosyltransferase 61 catalytic domain-containing protein n=2 Tax=Perkinsus olseni TaxID=32597 RepID=A0A7J6Q5W0_PEROL|nr:hypothetical protein FOZ63_018585 [Perkinsus olseni]